jgi:hypothetical protein
MVNGGVIATLRKELSRGALSGPSCGPGRIALRVEAQAQRAAVVIADRPLRLPSRERPSCTTSVTSAGDGSGARARPTLTFDPTVRPCSRSSRALNERIAGN